MSKPADTMRPNVLPSIENIVSILDSVSDGVIIVNQDRNIQYINKRATAL